MCRIYEWSIGVVKWKKKHCYYYGGNIISTPTGQAPLRILILAGSFVRMKFRARVIFRIIPFTIVFFDPENNVLFSGSKTSKVSKIGKQRKEEGEIHDRFFS